MARADKLRLHLRRAIFKRHDNDIPELFEGFALEM